MRDRVVWVLVGVVAAALVVLVAVLVTDASRDGPDGGDDVAASPGSTGPSQEPADGASQEPTAGPADDPADDAASDQDPADDGEPAEPGLPLRDPGDHLPADGSSDVPAAGSDLVEGDYFVHLEGIDAAARTVDVDVEVFYTGQAAVDYLAANEPDAGNPPPNDYWIANDSPTVRTVGLADDVRVWDWCQATAGGELAFAERTVAEWAAAPAGGGDMACDAGSALSRGDVYWLQVRGGQVARVIGQYLP